MIPIKDNFLHFINNTKYSFYTGKLANYIILEEQPEFNISSPDSVFVLHGLCIISSDSADYLLVGAEFDGRVRLDCMKITGVQLLPISDTDEWAQCNNYVGEVMDYMRRENG